MKLPTSLYATIAIAAIVFLGGCHKRFTRAHFESIKEGADTREDVREILGKPKVKLDNQWTYDNKKKHYSAIIYYDVDGRVAAKEWIDARTGEWSGQNPYADEPPAGEVRERKTKTSRIQKD